MNIPGKMVGIVLGYKGENAKFIAMESNARVSFVNRAKDAAESTEDQVLSLSGAPECCAKAREMVEDVMSASKESSGANDPNAVAIKISAEQSGVLLARASTMKRVRKESGARTDVVKDKSNPKEQMIYITGNSECVEHAKHLCDQIVNTVQEAGLPAGSSEANQRPSENAWATAAVLPMPGADGLLTERIYIDELNLKPVADLVRGPKSGYVQDDEIFIRGLPEACTEKDLWQHMNGMQELIVKIGPLVKSILLLRRLRVSRGMAYVEFTSGQAAKAAIALLHDSLASSIPCDGSSEATGRITARWSESQRCLKRNMVGTMRGGQRGRQLVAAGGVVAIKEESGLASVVLHGADTKQASDKLHLKVKYLEGEEASIQKAISCWEKQLEDLYEGQAREAQCRAKNTPAEADEARRISAKAAEEARVPNNAHGDPRRSHPPPAETFHQLPRPWRMVPYQNGYGSVCYYVNEETGESSWHPPPPRPSGPSARAGQRDRSRSPRPTQKRRGGDDGAPPGEWGQQSTSTGPGQPRQPALPPPHLAGGARDKPSQRPKGNQTTINHSQLCFPRAQLGDDRLLDWSQDLEAPDGGPALLKGMDSQYLDVVDFSNNGLTDRGVDTLIDFLIESKKPTKKLKLYGNEMASCEAIVRLLEDPVCGLQNEASLQELHLSHNGITAPAMEELLYAIAGSKKPGPMSPPLWIRVERNHFSHEDMSEVAERLRGQLDICFVLGGDCTVSTCAVGADVHLVLRSH